MIDDAYIAMRKAQRAEALGNAAAATDSKAMAEHDRTKTQEEIINNQQGQLATRAVSSLANTHDALEKQKEMTAQERQARLDAEKKATGRDGRAVEEPRGQGRHARHRDHAVGRRACSRPARRRSCRVRKRSSTRSPTR